MKVECIGLDDIAATVTRPDPPDLVVVLLDIGEERALPSGVTATALVVVDTELPGIGCATEDQIAEICDLGQKAASAVIATNMLGGHVAAITAGLMCAAGIEPRDALNAALGGQGLVNGRILSLFDKALDLEGKLLDAGRATARAKLASEGMRTRLPGALAEGTTDDRKQPGLTNP